MGDCNKNLNGDPLISDPSGDPLISSPSGDPLISGENFDFPLSTTVTFKSLDSGREIELRAPRLNNVDMAKIEMQHHVAMDGSVYTYKNKSKTTQRRMEFEVRRNKAEELKDFIEATHGEDLRMTDYLNRSWDLVIEDDVVELSFGKEFVTTELVFKGIRR